MDETKSRFKDSNTLAPTESNYLNSLDDYFESSVGSNVEKLENFAKYVPRQKLARFICKYELFRKILHVQGSIVECGVLYGGGLMSWAQLSAILEPVNHQRRIIGFDTFSGYEKIADEDKSGSYAHMHEGGLAIDTYEDLMRGIALFDSNRTIGHIPKVHLVKGDLSQTAPAYIEENPQTIVSMLYLDANLYEPTKAAIETFVPRMPKGAVIVFDAINSEYAPGETTALLKTLGLSKLRIERFPFDSMPSYAVLD